MSAIVVPGITDLNKGDQALVWESVRLVKDTGLFDDIFILKSGDTKEEREELCSQTDKRGYHLISQILHHPRRGKHRKSGKISEGTFEFFRLIKNAVLDFLKTFFLLRVCNHIGLTKFFFSETIAGTVEKFAKADCIFVKGGGFIHAYGERTAPYLMWYFLFYIRLAQKLGKKVVVLPNSFGPFEGLTVKSQVKKVLGNLDLIYAREEKSAKSLGLLLGREIQVEMDLGFSLNTGDTIEAQKVFKKYALSESDKIIGVTVRPWRFPGEKKPEDKYRRYIKSISKVIELARNKGMKIVLCNQSLGPGQHEDDRNAIRDLIDDVKDENLIWLNENLPCDILKAVYAQFYFFIGTRFHSVIFAMTSKIPSLAISYGGNKGVGIMKDFNLDKLVIPINEVNELKLQSAFEYGLGHYEAIRQKLNDSIQLVEDSRQRIIKDIQGLFL